MFDLKGPEIQYLAAVLDFTHRKEKYWFYATSAELTTKILSNIYTVLYDVL